jgi:type II secretory pathway component GspD/PulD (secretin)
VLAGLQICAPYALHQHLAFSTVSTTSLGGTLDAGTEITVTPKVAEGERITREYSVSVSTLVGEASDPTIPPPRQENHIQSIVTIPNGYAVVVGGLEIATDGEDQTSVPTLGDIPLLGAQFRSDSKSTLTNRFYVFLHCSIQNDDHFESLRYISDQAREEVGLPSDYPKIKPMVMR